MEVVAGRAGGAAAVAERLCQAEMDEMGMFLARLTPAQWDAPSLCTGWRVRDVVGHLLANYRAAPPPLIGKLLLRSSLQFSGLFDRSARQYGSAKEPAALLADFLAIDRNAGMGRFVPREVMLADHLVHHQDIRRPLGLPRTIPPERLSAALDALLRNRQFGLDGGRLAAGLRLVATDSGWTHGSGPEVRGPGEALAVTLAGRTAALGELSGDGVRVLTARCGA